MGGSAGTSDKGRRRASGKSKKATGPFVNHDAAMKFLDSTINIERVRPDRVQDDVWKLDRIRALMKELGDPQDELEIVHIAGSKGKGSVCNMLEGALQGCGYTTGVFTSPHLIDVRERVRIGGVPISESHFDDALARCRAAGSEIESEHGTPTYFEVLTALALLVFAQQAVDLVVLETGLGGRLDCTNIVTPIIVGLTSIQLEHTQILGMTIEQVAAEKAGIMKQGIPAISVPQTEEVLGVFRACSQEVGAKLSVLGDEVLYTERFQSGVRRGPHGLVCVGDEPHGFEHISVPLMGMHQAGNCGLTMAILMELRRAGFELPERKIVAGFSQMDQRGRLEMVMEQPRIMIDGAHTPESVACALKAVAAHIDFDSLIVVFGCSDDKDIDGMLKGVQSGADKVIFTCATGNPRANDPEELRDRFEQLHNTMVDSRPTLREAINAAAVGIGGQDLIIVIGSFYLAGETKRLIESRASRR